MSNFGSPTTDSTTSNRETTTYELFICGHNMTGYLPESDTPAFTSWEDAKAYLIGEMLWTSDGIETGAPDPWGEEYATSLRSSMEDLNLSSGPDWSDVLDAGRHAQMSWWITHETFADKDACYQRVTDVVEDEQEIEEILYALDARWFAGHAGFSWDRETETETEGRERCGRELATAERWAHNMSVEFVWEDDEPRDHAHEIGGIYDEIGEPSTCETCTAYWPNGDVATSLGCIDDATDDYRRVVEAELALEASTPVVTRLDAGDDDDRPTDSTRALLFGVLADLSAPTVSHYRSDWYHDARWVREHVSSAPFTFAYSWDEAGTSIGTSVEHVAYRRHAVLVTLVYERNVFRASVERIK